MGKNILCGIYKITNTINGKIYVGQSIDIHKRWYEHKHKSNNQKDISYNSAIHLAIRKYGIDNFEFSILEECNAEELDDKERFYIQELDSLTPNGYNITLGGQKNKANPPTLCAVCGTIIYKEAISSLCRPCYNESLRKGRPQPLDLAKMIVEKGFTSVGSDFNISGNAIKKWCKTYKIPHLLQELKEWYYEQIGQSLQIETPKTPIKKSILQIDPKTNKVVAQYESASEAGRALGKGNSHIVETCNGKHKTAYGYIWKYTE